MKLKYYPYTLKLKYVFTLSSYSRITTPIILTEIEHEGITGFGEASLPPYLGETQESGSNFLSKINLEQFEDPFRYEEILDYIDKIEEKNNAAKASVDIALHDLAGKLRNITCRQMFNLEFGESKFTSFTIGIDSIENIKRKVTEAEEYRILKVKLGGENDKEIINAVREITWKPISIDVNQGWKDKEYAFAMADWLADKNVLFIEQPFPVEWDEETFQLKDKTNIPIIADEAVKTSSDLFKIKDIYSGINVKLMKSKGMKEAFKMMTLAKHLGLKILLGCMTETSCAISAASQLTSLADWLDLDGALLINNDVFDGTKIIDGKIIINKLPGIGIKKI